MVLIRDARVRDIETRAPFLEGEKTGRTKHIKKKTKKAKFIFSKRMTLKEGRSLRSDHFHADKAVRSGGGSGGEGGGGRRERTSRSYVMRETRERLVASARVWVTVVNISPGAVYTAAERHTGCPPPPDDDTARRRAISRVCVCVGTRRAFWRRRRPAGGRGDTPIPRRASLPVQCLCRNCYLRACFSCTACLQADAEFLKICLAPTTSKKRRAPSA